MREQAGLEITVFQDATYGPEWAWTGRCAYEGEIWEAGGPTYHAALRAVQDLLEAYEPCRVWPWAEPGSQPWKR